ncbi:MAG: hypothetical protein ACRDAM_02750 [Casimicrobium sp.]
MKIELDTRGYHLLALREEWDLSKRAFSCWVCQLGKPMTERDYSPQAMNHGICGRGSTPQAAVDNCFEIAEQRAQALARMEEERQNNKALNLSTTFPSLADLGL